ncbi:hypothetical protein GGR39_000013 [Novosphingobium fluoreni]|uniref:DUF2322 family protein n=1 Tax=Novosphingobium fluoreni TaxID=1391222 RepID=A0A7W6FWI4_9SPHN|nr:DUF2322 family protein [Novosphingobium fluoreni]MBB3938384.1 hypothetical protein [Novosphingobium fluoreni]
MPQKIEPAATLKENVQQLPSVEGVERIELADGAGQIIGTIAHVPGKTASLAVYQYLAQLFPALDRDAAEYGLALYAQFVAEARETPGAHPNIDHLLAVVDGAPTLTIRVVRSS